MIFIFIFILPLLGDVVIGKSPPRDCVPDLRNPAIPPPPRPPSKSSGSISIAQSQSSSSSSSSHASSSSYAASSSGSIVSHDPKNPASSRGSSGSVAVAHSSSSASSSSSHASSSSFAASASGSICQDTNRCNDKNAMFKKCPDPCPPTCENPAGVPNCLMMCQDFGCECKKGFVFQSDIGKCVRLNNCPDYLRCNGDRNATFKECPNPCPRTCQMPDRSGPCSRMCLKEGCECKKGYVMNDDGKCIYSQDCPIPDNRCDDPNATYQECTSLCPATCQYPDGVPCVAMCGEPGCVCKEGYILNEYGLCVQRQECPGARLCSVNETFEPCSIVCPTEYCPMDDKRRAYACDLPYPCESGCVCKRDYLRLYSTGQCILAYECPPVNCTRPNEEWNGCPQSILREYCSYIGKEITEDPDYCDPRCVCKPGFYRDNKDDCIPEAECGNLRCNDPNAVFKKCPNPCPGTCEYPGGTPCDLVCEKEGCECAPGFVRNNDGKCVPLDQCPDAQLCSANETFVYCYVGCPNNDCPKDDSLGIIACSPPYPCRSGCSCKGGYLRNTDDGRCVLTSECPAVTCTRQNEEYDTCPSPCRNDRCSDLGTSPICDLSFHSCRPQCVCEPGFYRNDFSLCVPPEECGDVGCNGDPNAVFKECPNPCPGTCRYPGGTPCEEICQDRGCECKSGYYMNEDNGLCVELKNCPGAEVCPLNETFVFCNAVCPPTQFCPEDDGQYGYACDQPYPCESGCACKKGYRRVMQRGGRCILTNDCPEINCTRDNEVWDSCPPYQRRSEFCSEIGQPIEDPGSCDPRCVCAPGFKRNNSDICIPEEKCPADLECGLNEMPVRCRQICPPQDCAISYTEYACGNETICEPGCDCKLDYLRNERGICIHNEKCPPPPVIPTCNENEELSNCRIVCPPQTCESIYTLYSCIADIPCEWGCNCIKGYLRNEFGVCIPSNECSGNPPLLCGYNEVASDCKITCPPQSCESIYSTYLCNENVKCEPGCNCKNGCLRNASGICIPSDECFLVQECDVPVECRPTCANPKPKKCPIVPLSNENIDGCKCKAGYILSDPNGVCIRVGECPVDQGCNGDPNSIVTSCPWPCPSTCESPNAGNCGKKCDVVGCQCVSGFILDSRTGKCIRPNKCKRGNPCGRNGTFVDCAFRCPNQNCPVDDSQYEVLCRPGFPCPSGCLCKDYYKRNTDDDRCVLASDCPDIECTRPNEEWNPCASECLAEKCIDIFQSYECYPDPKRCVPKCVCCNGYYRDEDGNCVPENECKPPCPMLPECRPTCAVPNPPGCSYVEPPPTNIDNCNCQQGYILSEYGGRCIKVEECPTNITCNGDPNAIVKECPLPCPSTCQSPDAQPCKRMCEPLGCECKPGYLRSDINGLCIHPDNCKGGNPCGPNATFVPCRYNCPTNFCPVDESRAIIICEFSPFAPCYPGCACSINHRLKSREEPVCIESADCRELNCTSRPNEVWDRCPLDCGQESCEFVDQTIVCNTLILNCNPRCVCKKNYFRNPKNDLCVSAKECRKINRKNPAQN